MSETTATPKPRHCRLCNRTEADVNPNTWPHSNGKPLGAVCRPCATIRKRTLDAEYKRKRHEARLADMASLTPAATTQAPATGTEAKAAVSVSKDRQPGELKLRRLDVAKALRDGADTINTHAGTVLMTLMGYVDNPASPHHEWALKLVAERILPKSMYDELGRGAAGVGGAGAGGPRITINVVAATPPAHQGGARVIDVTPIDDGASDGSD